MYRFAAIILLASAASGALLDASNFSGRSPCEVAGGLDILDTRSSTNTSCLWFQCPLGKIGPFCMWDDPCSLDTACGADEYCSLRVDFAGIWNDTSNSTNSNTTLPAPTPIIIDPLQNTTDPNNNGTGNGVQLLNLDDLCNDVVGLWKSSFPDAAIFPVIGLPANNKGVCLLTHTGLPRDPLMPRDNNNNGNGGNNSTNNSTDVNGGNPTTIGNDDGNMSQEANGDDDDDDSEEERMYINALPCMSPLCNNALFSFERTTGDRYLNLYEAMVLDIPGVNGTRSTAQRYVNALHAAGLDVAGVHFHWTGQRMPMIAVHHQNIGMDPREFSLRTIWAYRSVFPSMQIDLNRARAVCSPNNAPPS